MQKRLIIVGGSDGTSIGWSFYKAARELKDYETFFYDTKSASDAPIWLKRFNWHLRGHLPTHLHSFSQEVLNLCKEKKPDILLTTGTAPVNAAVLKQMGSMKVQRINYLTDDPWNKNHRSGWFFKALKYYDFIFSARQANRLDLKSASTAKIKYLPFGYDPDYFYPVEADVTYASDVLFVGGGDQDRVPYMQALICEGFDLALYGSYWGRYKQTKRIWRGMADLPTLRRLIKNTKVALCLVRKSNRDGNVMRTFETPVVGACMLTEDTPEHRQIFGEEGKAVLYFKTIAEMIHKTNFLIQHENERKRLAEAAHYLITKGNHTYKDRLNHILNKTAINITERYS